MALTGAQSLLMADAHSQEDTEISADSRCSCQFEKLPTETLIEIFHFFNWRDILRLRKTSKRLFVISRSRPIWATLFEKVRPLLLMPSNASLSKYPTSKLEDLFLRRIRAEEGLTSKKPHTRFISRRPLTISNFSLVPGGRWLLVVTPDTLGCVLVYDLDANATGSDPHVLIQPETDFEKFQSLRHILVDVNYEEPSFPFTLCAVPDTYSHKSVAGKPTVRVDHVAPAEEGVLATISASKLTSFMLPSSGVCFCSYLCGSKIARYISHDSTNRTKRRIEVYTWTRSAGSVVRFQTIITDHPFSEREHIRLLSESVLLYCSGNRVSLYELEASDCGGPNNSTIFQPFWRWSNKGGHHFRIVSPIFCGSSYVRVTLASRGGYFGFTIPHDLSPPVVERLCNLPTGLAPEALSVHTHFTHLGNTLYYTAFTWAFDRAGLVTMPKSHNAGIILDDLQSSSPCRPLFDDFTSIGVLSAMKGWVVFEWIA